MATTLYRVDGVKLSNGRQAYGSKEMSLFYPVYRDYMKKIHKINLVLIKLGEPGGSSVSGRSHSDGNCADNRRWNLTKKQNATHIYQGTRLGLRPFERFPDEGFESHTHSILDTGKTHAASYQLTAMMRGRNGLVSNRADRSKSSRPPQSKWLRYDKGIVQMMKEMDPRPTVSLKLTLQNIKTKTKHTRIKRIQKALNKALGKKLTVDGLYGSKTKSAYLAWQKTLYKSKSTCDGIPGKDSLTKLGNKTKVFRAHQFS
jgi:hypothetical protein